MHLSFDEARRRSRTEIVPDERYKIQLGVGSKTMALEEYTYSEIKSGKLIVEYEIRNLMCTAWRERRMKHKSDWEGTHRYDLSLFLISLSKQAC